MFSIKSIRYECRKSDFHDTHGNCSTKGGSPAVLGSVFLLYIYLNLPPSTRIYPGRYPEMIKTGYQCTVYMLEILKIGIVSGFVTGDGSNSRPVYASKPLSRCIEHPRLK